MSVLYLAVLIILFMVILIFTAVLKIAFTLDTEHEKTRVVVLWLYPFLKAVADTSPADPYLTVTLFNKKVYKGKMGFKKTGAKNMDLIKAVSTSNVRLSVRYGFRDPFVTGVACGAINAASEFVHFASFKQNPDFVSDDDYICMNATGNVKVGNTLINFIKAKYGHK